MEKVESTILRNLLCSEDFYRKVVPFVKPDYFQDMSERVIFEEIHGFSTKYDKIPTKEVLNIGLQQRTDLNDDTFKTATTVVENFNDEWVDIEWLLDSTEKWCQERAVYNALLQSIKIADGGDEKLDKGAIPSILQDALAVSFDEYIGHDYVDQALDRYEYYHKDELKIPFDLEKFNSN